MEELQEADVLWPAAAAHHRHQHLAAADQHPHAAAVRRQSPPVRIPAMTAAEGRPTTRSYDDGGGMIGRRASSSGAESGIVPPHVLAARRCPDEPRVASSVCVGHGRTLKGRDLRAVRNTVLHMTGFLSSSDKY